MKKSQKYLITALFVLIMSLFFFNSITGASIIRIDILIPIWKSFVVLLLIATFIVFVAFARDLFLQKRGIPKDSELESRIKKSYKVMAFIGLLKSLKKRK